MEREVFLTVNHGSDSKKYENVSFINFCIMCARQCLQYLGQSRMALMCVASCGYPLGLQCVRTGYMV